MVEIGSYEHAVFRGAVKGPNGMVVDEQDRLVDPGVQDFNHTQPGREVRHGTGKGDVVGYVIDFQDPEVVERAETMVIEPAAGPDQSSSVISRELPSPLFQVLTPELLNSYREKGSYIGINAGIQQ